MYAITDEAGLQPGRQVSPMLMSLKDWRREAAVPRSFIGKVRASPKVFLYGSIAVLARE